jgi:hypothetical protein
MILRLVVADSSRSPAVAESVELGDDGTLTGWRSVSDGGVGWFAGTLPPGERAGIQALVAAAGSAPPSAPPPPGSAQEVLELPATGPISIAGIDADDGAWSDLAEAARQLLRRLTDFPRAAVTVRHAAPGVARLIHRGSDPLRLDLSAVAVRATGWRDYFEPAGDWSGEVAGPGEIEAGPGWTHDLPFEQPPGADVTVHLTVDLVILSDSSRVPVQAQHTP